MNNEYLRHGGYSRRPALRTQGGSAVPHRTAPRPPDTRRAGRRFRLPQKGRVLIAILLALLLGAAILLTALLAPTGESKTIAGPPFVIALDAGHGGDDVGASGVIPETELTQRTVAILYGLLEEDALFTPVLCRQLDEGATPLQRAKTAKKQGAALLFSVHGNAHSSPDTAGFECYPAPPGRTWHQESLALAGLVAAEMQAAGATLRGEGGIRYLYYTDGGQKNFVEASDTSVYPTESFTVLERPGCIALLAEQCFVTSPADVAAFGTEAGCQRAAECYYRAIRAFFLPYAAQGK